MAMDYNALEDRLFGILLNLLPKSKYATLNNAPLINRNQTKVNYHSDKPIWFYRHRIDNGDIYYYFGFKNDDDVKLKLKSSRAKSRSFIVFFVTGKIAVKVKFTKEGAKIFDLMKKIFNVKNNSSILVKYNYLMLIYNDESEIISEITKLMEIIDFGYGKDHLIIKGFKENIDDDYLDRLMELKKSSNEDSTEVKKKSTSDKILNKEESEKGIERNVSQSKNSKCSVEKIISNIDCTAFKGESSANENLIEKFDEFLESPIIDIIFNDLNDEEQSKLIIRIKDDLHAKNISGDIADILDFYLEQYNSIKRQFSLSDFLNDYVQSEDFQALQQMNNVFREELIISIIDRVRKDIDNDASMDEDKIVLRLEYYFKAEQNKNDYFSQIDEIRENSSSYMDKYNLNADEFEIILNYIQIKITEGYHIKNIHECLIRKIKEEIDKNRHESLLKLKSFLNNPEFIEKNDITQEDLDFLNEWFGNQIYNNQIRSNEITEKDLLAQLLFREWLE